ncbi:phenol hydroxylase subunit P4 [Halopseudomonas pachastrellae]|nr:phenol hydroxylase subunit P4 [Halopseudomonas pachastrellae]
MSVKALYQYTAEPRDLQANFNGMQLVYLYWPNHLLFCSPFSFLASPEMSMGEFCEEVVRPAIAAHRRPPAWTLARPSGSSTTSRSARTLRSAWRRMG